MEAVTLLLLLSLPLSAVWTGSAPAVAAAAYDDDDDDEEEDADTTATDTTSTDTVAVSHLVMPNAFSPNKDLINDTYGAIQSKTDNIVEFHAIIINRWGQKLYSWSDVKGSWDGTYKGKPVKAGVYFCRVRAKGSDGREYDIKKDVNLIRSYNEVTDSGGDE